MGVTVTEMHRLKTRYPDILKAPLIQLNKLCEIALCSSTTGRKILQALIDDGLKVFKSQAEGRSRTYFYEADVLKYLSRYEAKRRAEIKIKQAEKAQKQIERNKARYAKFKEYLAAKKGMR